MTNSHIQKKYDKNSYINYKQNNKNIGSWPLKLEVYKKLTQCYTLIRPLPPMPDFKCPDSKILPGSPSRDTTQLIRPYFHCNRGGLIREGLILLDNAFTGSNHRLDQC
jgi:hypothetical protein